MSSQELVSTSSNEEEDREASIIQDVESPPRGSGGPAGVGQSFWRDRLVEIGMVLSMAAYYVLGNSNLGTNKLFHINPLLTLPFLLVFAVLCWYRLPFAVALVPVAVPYFLLEKPVYSHYEFELAEIALAVCVAVTLLQLLFQQNTWSYLLSWRELRDRIGPFIYPIAIFILAAAISVVIAFAHRDALRAFREEVFDPILYMLLAFYCLRTRQDVTRLLLALFASAFIIALQGLAQYFLFRHTLVLEADGVRRVHALFGSANDIGLFFDYSLPIGIALLVIGRRNVQGFLQNWGVRIGMLALLLPMLLVLYLSQSLGAWIAIGVAALAIVLLSIRSRKALLLAGVGLVVILGLAAIILRHPIEQFFVKWHANAAGIGTFTKRLYLWESALKIIHDHFLFGVGMDNWLCYYSRNTVCVIPSIHAHYWVLTIPGTNIPTGLQAEPNLSHPHNIFLHVWVSIGIFGLLAFIALLVFFFWLFRRVFIKIRSDGAKAHPDLEWMLVGTGAAMLAGLVQGQVDSAFLAQDLAFCFWMLVTSLLLLRLLTNTSWCKAREP